MCDYSKVVRLPIKPREKSEALKKEERMLEEFQREPPDNPFIKVGNMMEEMYQQMKRDKREREDGFVLDNSHRRPGG